LILGGESGDQFGPSKYRPSELAWYEKTVKDLKDKTDVAVFVKQLGCHLRDTMNLKHHHGGDINEFPKSLQIREFPIDGIEHML
jgi:protein gp37